MTNLTEKNTPSNKMRGVISAKNVMKNVLGTSIAIFATKVSHCAS